MHRSTSKLVFGIGAVGAFLGVAWLLLKKKRLLGSTESKIMDMIPELKRPCVKMKDPENVQKILCHLVQGGKDKLQVIADFDRTLSRYMNEDMKICSTCHNMLDDSPLMPDMFTKKATELRDTYYPIEIDPTLTIEEKYPFMVEWWTKAHTLLVQCNLSQKMLHQIIKDSNIHLRTGTEWQFQQLHKHQVPLLIFSAGLGDVIDRVIRMHATLYDNIKIISNFMDFNHHGNLVGFTGDLIHSFNKNESALQHSDYFNDLKNRTNVLLLGDSEGDVGMANGLGDACHVLKIGFLNAKIEERLPSFLDLYDIILISDESMDIPNAILKSIL